MPKKPTKKPTIDEVTVEAVEARILGIVQGLIDRYESQINDPDFRTSPKDILDAMRLGRDLEDFTSRFDSIQSRIKDLKSEVTKLEDMLIGLIEK